ncbi:shikimate dehydrogenase [Brachybacterium sp. DNPG3]
MSVPDPAVETVPGTATGTEPRTRPGSGRPRRFAVVGSPISHSLSPLLHSTAYRDLGVDDAEYVRHEVGEGELAAFLASGPGAALDGLSVTMPDKREAFELATERDATSRRLGISNTLLRREDGTWRAENHDVHGIVAALRDHGADGVRRAGVLGSGATALSAVAALAELGAEEILLSARSPEKLVPVADLARESGVAPRLIAWESSSELLTSDVVISALALPGAQALARTWAEHPDLPAPRTFLDVLYHPWPAPLAALVGRAGADVADGLEMLVHQADMQVRSMIGVPAAPVPAMLAAARAELARHS